MRAEILDRQDVAGGGHAGGLGLRHRADGVQLAGGQLSALRRLDGVGGRAGSLLVSLDTLERAEESGVGYIQRSEEGEAALRLCNLSVTLDDGTQVINETDVSIEPGEKVLVVGESGTGKSSLVRALAGLWPWGGGEIHFRKGSELFLLPQRPYLPVGTLAARGELPVAGRGFKKDDVAKVMKQVGLGDFVDRLDKDEPWDHMLSGGEKQRLAFARLILQDRISSCMDEATSALDPPSQDADGPVKQAAGERDRAQRWAPAGTGSVPRA